MIEELRRQANEAAQDALRALIKVRMATGRWDPYLEAKYHAAERLVDIIEATIEAEQVADPGAPDYFGIFDTEAEARAAWGDR
jgi:hypothetical protein